ncbi:helix-turn-helix domain-containing protein [Dictyobacter aurantiacus]|uniref:AraC family transcriptional regulator n=1 Tax=Dictyobacter aurantiacus TaxID=1936993 RepID=A0A401ZPY6_9CHLR|nr:helix-turn-helix domain-containing protein [Dictyobacter aurantiacus]GCE08968.1 AraC family transcriptional regulator [Dictyobacter aurantiacus]
MLPFCHEWNSSASGRKDKEHQKTAMHTVAVLIYDSVNPFELAVATEVFGFDRPELNVPWYRFLVCACEPRPIRSSAGFLLTTPYTLEQVEEANTIIIPGSRPGVVPVPETLLASLRKCYQRGARIITLCTATFILAAAGLLDGRCVTTHWAWAAELAARYPRVQVDPKRLYTDDGQILTSAGTAAAIDLSLHVVRQDYGAEVAAAVVRRMVVPPHRDGSQAQYIQTPLLSIREQHEPFGATLEWITANLQEDITVEQMAARAAMSPRTFARRFQATIGTTPYQWLLQQRIALAQRQLETTNKTIERIAACCGFKSAATFRLHFQRLLHVSPQRYRQSFHQAK